MGNLFEQINIGIWVGIILQILGRIVSKVMGGGGGGIDFMVLLGMAISFVGIIVFIWGCMKICVEKGYSKWLGLLGFFSCIGLLVILLLPES